MSRSVKAVSAKRADALVASLATKRKSNPIFDAQSSGLFVCNDKTHIRNERGGFTPAGFIAHTFGRKGQKCNAAAVLSSLIQRGILTPAEVVAARNEGTSPDVAAVLARA